MTNGCGEEGKGCFLYPRLSCSSLYTYAVAYKSGGDRVKFEMYGKTDGYISLGFSDDRLMVSFGVWSKETQIYSSL